MATSSSILKFYLDALKEDTGELGYGDLHDKVPGLLAYNKKMKGGDFLVPLSFYLTVLEKNQDIVLYKYMSDEQKRKLLKELRVTYLLLLTEKKYEIDYSKYENLQSYNEQIKQCETLIDALNKKEDEQNSPEQGYAMDEKPVKYLGLQLGITLSQKMALFTHGASKIMVKGMSNFNEKRLFWVWGSSLIKVILDLMPADYFYTSQAKKTMKNIDPITGYISWILYYFRFSIGLGLLLKHTIRGPWMSEEEKKIPWTERFKTQWSQRKFTLLNDSLWATANLVSFFWLTAKKGLGPWGDLLTIGLLAFDIGLSVWDYEEQRVAYNKEMLDYENDIISLRDQISEAKKKQDLEPNNWLRKIKEYEMQLNVVERARKHCKMNWDIKKVRLHNSIAYAVGLMITFALLAMPFLPISGPAILGVIVAGAVLCYATTVIYNGINSTIEINRAKVAAKEAEDDRMLKIQEFRTLLKENPDLDDNEKKLMFLEVKQLMAENEYQKRLAKLHTMHFIRSVILESVIPAFVLVSFVFLPMGIGFGVLAAGLAVAFASRFIVDKIYKPKKGEVIEFDEKEYKEFCKDPENWNMMPKEKSKSKSKTEHTFFKRSSKEEIAQDDTQALTLNLKNS